MKDRKRFWIALACFALLAALLVSSAYALMQAGHVHHGCVEKCSVCEAVARIETMRRALALALAFLAVGLFAAPLARSFESGWREAVSSRGTPVGRKVRLNN